MLSVYNGASWQEIGQEGTQRPTNVSALAHTGDGTVWAAEPGKGLWAAPGGFLEPRDTLWQSCLRELSEETACPLDEATLRAAMRAVKVFDHPDRSQRGRTITHGHYFDLGNIPLPPVVGGDDAQQALWVPLDQLAAMEDQLFEDHFHLLDSFLGLTTPA